MFYFLKRFQHEAYLLEEINDAEIQLSRRLSDHFKQIENELSQLLECSMCPTDISNEDCELNSDIKKQTYLVHQVGSFKQFIIHFAYTVNLVMLASTVQKLLENNYETVIIKLFLTLLGDVKSFYHHK